MTVPGTPVPHPDQPRHGPSRLARGPIRIALVMDHPAQQFARALQLLADEPGLQMQVYYWSTPESSYDVGFARPVSWDIDLIGGYPARRPILA